jgi:hypothetical protein
MWTEKDTLNFKRLYADFTKDRWQSKAEKVTIARFMSEQGFPKLASKFLKFAAVGPIRSAGAIHAASLGKVCAYCNACFPRSTVCQDCRKSPEGRALSKKIERQKACDTMVGNGGVGMANPKTLAKVQKTFLKRYGTKVPLAYNSEVVSKARKTMVRRHGGKFVAHCPELMKRVQASTFGVKKFEFRGKEFEFQGYEHHAIQWIVNDFGYDPNQVFTQYEKPKSIFFRRNGRLTRYTPDLYLKETDLCIEVKSLYTLGFERHDSESVLRFNRDIQKQFNRTGKQLRFVLVSRSGICFALPKLWHLMPTKSLLTFIQDRI